MRFSVAVFLVLLFALPAAADVRSIKVKVLDPQSAAVAGAQVSLLHKNETTILATQATSPEGDTTFQTNASGRLQIRVLAPGFAPATVDVSTESEVTMNLHLSTASETVVVSATRTPVPGEAAGADVDSLSNAQLDTMRPVAANDALRFLPGAVVNTAGQHGGLLRLSSYVAENPTTTK